MFRMLVVIARRSINSNTLSLNHFTNLQEFKRLETRPSNLDKLATYASLEGEEVVLRQGVGLGNNRNKVDASTEAFHDFNIKRF